MRTAGYKLLRTAAWLCFGKPNAFQGALSQVVNHVLIIKARMSDQYFSGFEVEEGSFTLSL